MFDHVNASLRRIPIWVVYIVGALPPPFLLYLGATGGLGVEPIKALEHELGELGLKLLVLGLAVTPLRRYFGLNLMRFRRAIGVLAFYYITCHLLVWLILDVRAFAEIWADIVKRPYITVGMLAFILMIPLAATSNDWSVRKLGPMWRKLHRAVYVVAVLGGLHFLMLVKGLQMEPLLNLGTILVLLALRLHPRQRQSYRSKQAISPET